MEEEANSQISFVPDSMGQMENVEKTDEDEEHVAGTDEVPIDQ